MKYMERKPVSSSATEVLDPSIFLARRNFTISVFLLGIVLLSIGAAQHTGFHFSSFFTALPRVTVWVVENFVPDAAAWARFPNIMAKLVDTFMISIMSTVTASVLSLVFAIMAARPTCIHPFWGCFAKMVASISRNIPVAAWAMIFLITFGMSSFTGYLALFFATFGFLTRAFIETIDEVSGSQVEALRASGASYWHVVSQAVIPTITPQAISWVLYMVETNIRDAALIGLLTGSGIGFLFDLYYKTMQYRSASLIVLLLVGTVLGIELISNVVRRRVL